MKTLIAVVTAIHRTAWRTAIRSTWWPQVPEGKADARFFMGRGKVCLQQDEVLLDCDDSYLGLPEKIRAIAKWALDNDYDYMLKCDDDVVLRPNDLLESGYGKFDFSGKANRPPQPYVVSFGFNYWLSKRSMQCIVDADIPPHGDNDDEKWVAKTLWSNGIVLENVNRYSLHSTLEKPPVRFDRRPLRLLQPQVEKKDSYIVSRCIHFEGVTVDEETKLQEFNKVFHKYGAK